MALTRILTQYDIKKITSFTINSVDLSDLVTNIDNIFIEAIWTNGNTSTILPLTISQDSSNIYLVFGIATGTSITISKLTSKISAVSNIANLQQINYFHS